MTTSDTASKVGPFRLDLTHDRDSATDGSSRYGHYLRAHAKEFTDLGRHYDDPRTIGVRFALTAWRVGTGPIMAPGVVRCESGNRIQNYELSVSDWNGELVAVVDFLSDIPSALFNHTTPAGEYYRTETTDWRGDPIEVGGQELERDAYLTSSVRMIVQIPSGTVPDMAEVPTSEADRWGAAVSCLHVLTDVLNAHVAPIIAKLEGGNR